MRNLIIRAHTWLSARGDAGQATTEYALVLLGAAAIALLPDIEVAASASMRLEPSGP